MNKIHYILFTMTFATKAITDGLYVSRKIDTPIDDLKYVFMILSILLLIFENRFIEKQNPKKIYKKFFVKELKNINIVIFIFTFISLISILINQNYTTETIKEIFYLWIPGIYAFLLLNKLSIKDMDKYFTTLLICFIFGYYLEIYDKLSISNFMDISYADSYSPFESAYVSGAFTSIFLYFLYRNSKLRSTISFIFVMLSFKRLSILFCIVISILYYVFDMKKNVCKKNIIIIKIIFIILPIIIYFYLRPQNIYYINTLFNIDLDKILMGRARIFNEVLESGFISYGYGSTTDLVLKIFPEDGHLHLDLVKIFMEMTVVGLIIFVNNIWNVAGRNRYAILIMMYEFLNLLTSHSLRGVFSWTITYLIIGIILKQSYRREINNV